MDKNVVIFYALQVILHCVLAVCGTYLIVNNHVGCGIFALLLIWLTSYDYDSGHKKE